MFAGKARIMAGNVRVRVTFEGDELVMRVSGSVDAQAARHVAEVADIARQVGAEHVRVELDPNRRS
jgi:hypothetical protein